MNSKYLITTSDGRAILDSEKFFKDPIIKKILEEMSKKIVVKINSVSK